MLSASSTSSGKVKFHRDVILRSKGLLDMMYLPSELENELNGVVFERGKKYGARAERSQGNGVGKRGNDVNKSVEYKEKVVDEAEILSWFSFGLPAHKMNGDLFIYGTELKAWIDVTKKARNSKTQIGTDEVYCMTCKQVVKLVQPEAQAVSGNLVYKKGICPICGGKVVRGGRND